MDQSLEVTSSLNDFLFILFIRWIWTYLRIPGPSFWIKSKVRWGANAHGSHVRSSGSKCFWQPSSKRVDSKSFPKIPPKWSSSLDGVAATCCSMLWCTNCWWRRNIHWHSIAQLVEAETGVDAFRKTWPHFFAGLRFWKQKNGPYLHPFAWCSSDRADFRQTIDPQRSNRRHYSIWAEQDHCWVEQSRSQVRSKCFPRGFRLLGYQSWRWSIQEIIQETAEGLHCWMLCLLSGPKDLTCAPQNFLLWHCPTPREPIGVHLAS